MSDVITANGRHLISERQPLVSAFCGTLIWAITATIALALVAMILGAPIAQANGHPAFATPIYKAFSFVCHQIPERSFHLAGYKFAVCSRCTGLYSGFALAALIYPIVRSLRQTETPSILWLFLATVPLVIDFSLGYFSIWQNNHASRFATGALLGSVAVFYILPGLIELGSKIRLKKKATLDASP
ncbi:MAG TPA: hypothetical protein DC054_23085 [Blastocatellia bacterium]|nr:hypothetical protein [Blastocatellia bacterium]